MTTSSDSGKEHDPPQHKIPAPQTHGHHHDQPWPAKPNFGRGSAGAGRQAYTVHVSKGNKRHHKPGK